MQLTLLPIALVLVIVVVQESTSAPAKENGYATPSYDTIPPRKNGNGKENGKRRLSDGDREVLLTNCQKKQNKCKGQTDESKQSRQRVKDDLKSEIKTRKAEISDPLCDKEVEVQMNKVFNLKKKINEINNVSEIEPADDGYWEGDIVLNTEQAKIMMKYLNDDSDDDADTAPGDHKKKRSAAIFFKTWPNYRWKMPIHYWISNSFSPSEKSIIESGLATITESTGCITFVKDTIAFVSGAQIQYHKQAPPSSCPMCCAGDSPMGCQSPKSNRINIRGTSCSSKVLKGTVMHETIHSLGGDHEQTRKDRDKYVKILFKNIIPEHAHNFHVQPMATSYGVKYDYKSIMHYDQSSFSKSTDLLTIVPKNGKLTKMGSNTLSSNDILQLKKMYCKKSTCEDNDQACGTWALAGYCTEAGYESWMQTNCLKSCGLC